MSEVDKDGVDGGRRHFLLVATTVTGIAGAAMTAVPFLASWKPSARAQALGAPVEQDISKLESGSMVKVNWRGQAIFIVRRSPEMMKQLEDPALAGRVFKDVPAPLNLKVPPYRFVTDGVVQIGVDAEVA